MGSAARRPDLAIPRLGSCSIAPLVRATGLSLIKVKSVAITKKDAKECVMEQSG